MMDVWSVVRSYLACLFERQVQFFFSPVLNCVLSWGRFKVWVARYVRLKTQQKGRLLQQLVPLFPVPQVIGSQEICNNRDLNTVHLFFFILQSETSHQKTCFVPQQHLIWGDKKKKTKLKTCPPWLLLGSCLALSSLGRLCSTAFMMLACMYWPHVLAACSRSLSLLSAGPIRLPVGRTRRWTRWGSSRDWWRDARWPCGSASLGHIRRSFSFSH